MSVARFIETDVAIIGGGPAGLFAAECLAKQGLSVTVFDRMPSVGRKFLLAGRGGLNLTHSEVPERFIARYGWRQDVMTPLLDAFSPADLSHWAHGLGEETFVGSSGRVFPKSFKATQLLRAWLARLKAQDVRIETRQNWTGFDESGHALFTGADGGSTIAKSRAVLMATGGASWPRMGSDGRWVEAFAALGIPVAPLRPANCGIEIAWSQHMKDKGGGHPLKRIAISAGGRTERGEAMITGEGLEGGAVYAVLDLVRDEIAAKGKAMLMLDLRPDRNLEGLAQDIDRTPASQSTANRLRKGAKLDASAMMLLNEVHRPLPREAEQLARLIKNLPLRATATRPLERAISTAGGVFFEALDNHLMVRQRPGLFVAGEMLDWEAPTGGYLLQACFSSAKMACDGMVHWLDARQAEEKTSVAAQAT